MELINSGRELSEGNNLRERQAKKVKVWDYSDRLGDRFLAL